MSTTWVLLRGLARDARHWNGFPSALQSAIPGIEVVTPDLPGNGGRHAETSPDTVGGMVEAYRAAIQHLEHPVHLLGLSLGAMVATEWARRYPDEIASAVLVNGSTAESPFWQRMRPHAAWELLQTMFSPVEQREARIVSICTNVADRETASARWANYARNARTSLANAARQLRAAMRYRAPPGPIGVPALVVASAADRLASVECSIAMARRWGLALALHPCAGHELALDDPRWLARQCARWQAGLETIRSARKARDWM